MYPVIGNIIVTYKSMSLQCVTNHVQKFHKCTQCHQAVSTSDSRYLECLATLENLFPKYTAPDTTPEYAEMSSMESNQTISVVMLGGDSTVVEYKPSMTIFYLKSFVQNRLGPAPQKQRLLYKEQELKVRTMTFLPDKLTCSTLISKFIKMRRF